MKYRQIVVVEGCSIHQTYKQVDGRHDLKLDYMGFSKNICEHNAVIATQELVRLFNFIIVFVNIGHST